jgi:GDP-L-fucose synthase
MDKHAKIYVAGHKGLVGSAICRKLHREGFTNIVVRTKEELNLEHQGLTEQFFAAEKPEYVFLAAARVGGIMANSTYPAEFIYSNLAVQNNVIKASHQFGIKKLLFLGSSCIYPKFSPQPMKEEHLLTSPLEPTNEAYAIAKIAGLKMCRYFNEQYGTNYISVMPTNLYGPNDNYDPENSHVLPALILKFHKAKVGNLPEVTLWGTGSPRREFLHADDLADAVVFLMERYDYKDIGEIVNIGCGEDVTIKELAETVKRIVGFEGQLNWDTGRPDGTPRKLLDISRIRELGWQPKISLDQGITSVYEDFQTNFKRYTGA